MTRAWSCFSAAYQMRAIRLDFWQETSLVAVASSFRVGRLAFIHSRSDAAFTGWE